MYIYNIYYIIYITYIILYIIYIILLHIYIYHFRRPKNLFNKEKMKLYLKQTCRRTTVMSDDGYWVVNVSASQGLRY